MSMSAFTVKCSALLQDENSQVLFTGIRTLERFVALNAQLHDFGRQPGQPNSAKAAHAVTHWNALAVETKRQMDALARFKCVYSV